MATKILVRRDVAADWTTNNPTLGTGEFGYETDTDKHKVGDGATAWTSLAYHQYYSTALDTKLKAIETSATADQTDAEIRAAVEAATDSNVFTDADHTKLNGIEASADVNVATNLGYTASSGVLTSSTGTNVTLPLSDTNNRGLMSDSQFDKLAAVEASATADQTNAEIRTAVEAATDSNVFTDADHTKLNAIETSATADQTNAEIRTAVEAATDSNVFTDADHTKLNAIEASANVTDAANVDAAGAVMNSDSTVAAMSFVIDEDAMGSDLATKVPTQQSVKAYVDTEVASALTSEMSYKGGYNASTNSPDLDSSPSGVALGDVYTVTASGTFFSVAVEIGDTLIAEVASADAVDEWTIVNKNLDAASIKTSYESNSDTNEFSDAEQTKLGNIATSANLYVHPNHSGDVTSSADGATVIANSAVTLAKMANMATDSFIGRDTASAGAPEVLSAATVRTILNVADGATNYAHPTHPGDDFSVDTGALTGAVVVSDVDINVTTDTLGHVTDANGAISTRTLTLANLGYTGATNANYITNNNQITNGAGYTTAVGDITAVTAGTGMSGGGTSGAVTLTCTIDTPAEVGLGNLSNSGNNVAGSFTATGDITANSDISIKENIEVIGDAISKVKMINGVTFNRKDIEDERRFTGVIAQDVQSVLPEAIHTDGEIMSVAYGNMVGLLIEAIKEQQVQIDELKARCK